MIESFIAKKMREKVAKMLADILIVKCLKINIMGMMVTDQDGHDLRVRELGRPISFRA
jgi:hypothetical protein